MCSVHLKITELLSPQSRKHLKFWNKSSLQREEPSLLEGYFLDFSFFLHSMIPYCTVSTIEPDSGVMIGSTTRLKSTLQEHWFGFCSRYSSVRNEVTAWLFFWVDWVFHVYSPFLSPWWDVYLSWHFRQSLTQWRWLSDSSAPLLSGENGSHLALSVSSMIRFQATGFRWLLEHWWVWYTPRYSCAI